MPLPSTATPRGLLNDAAVPVPFAEPDEPVPANVVTTPPDVIFLIRKITSAGVVTTLAGSGSQGSANGTGTAASFNSPRGVAVDGSGNVYVADTYNHLIRKITSAGVVTTLAGSGSSGSANGKLNDAAVPVAFAEP